MSRLKIFISPAKWYYSFFVLIVAGFSLQWFLNYRSQVLDAFDFGIAVLVDEMWEEILKFEIYHGYIDNAEIKWTPDLLSSFQNQIAREFKDETVDSRLQDFGFVQITDLVNNMMLYKSPGLKESGFRFHEWITERWGYRPFQANIDGKPTAGIGYLDVRLGNHFFIGVIFNDIPIDSMNHNLLKYKKIGKIARSAVKRDGEKLYVQFSERVMNTLREANSWSYIYFYEKDSLIFSTGVFRQNAPFLPQSLYDKTFVATLKDSMGNFYRQRSEFNDHNIKSAYKIDVAVPERSVRLAIMHMGLYILFGVIVLIAIVGLGGHSLRKKVVKPVNDVIQIVNELSSKNIEIEIPHENVDEYIARLITTFNNLLNRLAKAFKQQKAFLADTSHELRTPLTILGLDISEALKKVDEKSQAALHLREAKREVAHLTRIVNDLQWLAKNDAGQLLLEKTKIRLDEVMIESMSRCQVLAQENKISLAVGHLDIVEYYGDYDLLVRAFSNLISNAVKYSKKQGKVKLSLIENDSTIAFHVEDEGIGIPEEALPKIFDRFYRVDKSRSRTTGGSGLGLAITRQIIELHHGKIKVESKINVGSRFLIELPVIKNAHAD